MARATTRGSTCTLTLTCGMGALADRNGGASDWRFKDTVNEADKKSGRVF